MEIPTEADDKIHRASGDERTYFDRADIISPSIFNVSNTIERTCTNQSSSLLLPKLDHASSLSNVEPGSIAKSILPETLYPTIYQSCYFLPMSPKDRSRYLPLLQYYPNSYLVITSEDEVEAVRLDNDARTIYIRGTDKYDLLWIKTAAMWNYISTQVNATAFKHCSWFFKVDTDTFLNLHVIEQLLSQYSHKEDHYLGWFAGRGGRMHKNKPVVSAIGAFYGFSRSIMQKWKLWDEDKLFVWGTSHRGEDGQVAYFLNDHGVCLDVPAVDVYAFRVRSGVWGVGPDYFKEDCYKKLHDLVNNYCFAYAHKVSLEWMPVLADIMAVHVVNQTKCDLFHKGLSRIVNGSIVYHQVAKSKSPCGASGCDPCLRDAVTNECCGWEVAK